MRCSKYLMELIIYLCVYIYIYIYDEWATTKQACRDELVVYLFFFSHIYIYIFIYYYTRVFHWKIYASKNS